jgi:hypothetical protein
MFKLNSLSFMAFTINLLLRAGGVNSVPVTNEPNRLYSSASPREGSYDERKKTKWMDEGELVSRLLLLIETLEFNELFERLNDVKSHSIFEKMKLNGELL